MSNPFEPPDGPPPEKGGGSTSAPASGSSSNPFEPPDSPPPPEKGSLAQGPPGIPGNRPGIPSSSSAAAAAPTGKGSAAAPVGVPDAMDVSIPDEPPPAYSSTPAQHTGESSVQAGPNRMDFSGPPPIPDRFQNQNYNAPQIEQHITGVGYGYRADPAAPQQGGYAPPPDAPPQKTNPFSGGNEKGSEKQPMNSQPTGTSSSGAGSSAPDLSPTEIATPGRPLLRKGQLLVYPKNHFCSKCGNTGYKKNDPNNPHDADWRKYGKPYNLALQTSYKSAVGPYANPATQASSNFQRPLPDFSRPPQHQAPPPPMTNPGLARHGGGWSQHPGNFRPPPPQHQQSWGPPPPPQHQQWGPPPPQIYHQSPYMGGGMMNGGLVVRPGDPRIGGVPCWRCGGEGRELSFFGFDDGKCKECRGIGRIFR